MRKTTNNSGHMKNRKFNWKYIFPIVLIVFVLGIFGLMYGKLVQLTNQLAYLQDSTSIILSDVDGMQSDIEKTLKQETSIIENYEFDIADMDFKKMTYDVNVSVIPKEYTEKTRVSVFFGTRECKLTGTGYVYTGKATLPLDDSFDGNVTFLIANDKKKNTEVLEYYEGLQTGLDKVLSGELDHPPLYKDGELSLKANCSFALDGAEKYEFDEFALVTELDGEEIYRQDLREELLYPEDEDAQEKIDSTEETGEALPDDIMREGSGEVLYKFSYEMPQEEEEQKKDQRIRVFLRAVTTDGYRFEYTVFQGNYLGEEDKLDKGSYDFEPVSVVYDKRDNPLKLDIPDNNEEQEVQ